MPASKKNTVPISKPLTGPKKAAKARAKPWIDPDEIPDQSGVPIEQWKAFINGRPAKFGRPVLDNPKKLVSIRLDADLVEHLRAEGPGWQTRANMMLRKAAKI